MRKNVSESDTECRQPLMLLIDDFAAVIHVGPSSLLISSNIAFLPTTHAFALATFGCRGEFTNW